MSIDEVTGAAQAPDPFTPPDPAVIRLWTLSHCVLTVIVAAPMTLTVFALGRAGLVVAAAVLLGGLAAARPLARRRRAAHGHQVRADDVLVRAGMVFRTLTLVPHVRIQHVDIRSGPLERINGLATVVIFTAGTVGGAVPVVGLRSGDAVALRDRLAALVGAGQAL